MMRDAIRHTDQYAYSKSNQEVFWKDHTYRNDVPSIATFSIQVRTFVPAMRGRDYEKTLARLHRIGNVEVEHTYGGANGDWIIISEFSTFEEAVNCYPSIRQRIEKAIREAPKSKKRRAS
jgi:hypothetical protein